MSFLVVFVLILIGLVSSQTYPKVTTWSGGHSGIPLNGSETPIYAVSNENGGVFTHFWVCYLATDLDSIIIHNTYP